MADYSTIKGFTVQSLASDPYASVAASGTWASAPACNTGRRNAGGLGTATAMLVFGGGPPVVTATEKWDNTSWTTVNSLNTARKNILSSAGITTAGMCVSSYIPPYTADVELYDGTSWSETANVNTARHSGNSMGAGNTAAVFAAGRANGDFSLLTETWNGTSWTEVGDLSVARRYTAGMGPATAALIAGGGISPGLYGGVETWNGSSWTVAATINTARQYLAGSGGSAAQTASLVFGGFAPAASALTEAYDGSAWAETGDLGTARGGLMGSTVGTTLAAKAAMGGPPVTAVSEGWTTASPVSVAGEGQVWYNTTSTVLKGFGMQGTGAWASGGTMNTPYMNGGVYIGTTTAGVYAGGIPGDVTTTQTYDGSVWSASPATLNTGRHYITNTGMGTSTAGQVMGGEIPAPPYYSNDSEQFDGSTWTETNHINTARIAIIGAGTQAAGLGMTGGGGGGTNIVESWDGTSWAAGTAANDSRKYAMGGGTQTSAIVAAGKKDPALLDSAETWDGSSWTEIAVVNTARDVGGRGATSDSSAIIFGGNYPPGFTGLTEVWNGSAWTEVADLATGRGAIGSDGTAAAAIAAGGSPPNAGATEAWNIPDAIKTFTAT